MQYPVDAAQCRGEGGRVVDVARADVHPRLGQRARAVARADQRPRPLAAFQEQVGYMAAEEASGSRY
jgi:hypothetical protein